jgi:hypothetical protein
MSPFANTGEAFTSPLGLILGSPLALIALVIAPLIVILHMLNLRWKDVEVSSLLFWDAVLREKRSSLRLRAILRNLILLAQLLVVGLLALALSQPLLSRASLSGRGNVILVLDTTASMESREGAGTRLDAAKARALDLVPALRRGSRMCVITAGRSPALIVPFTEDRERLQRAIREARGTDEAGDMRESILLALSLRDPKRDDRVVMITDGAFDSLGGPQSGPAGAADPAMTAEPSALADLDEGASWLSLIRVGENAANAGITALSLRKTSGSEEYEMFIGVVNSSPASMSFPLIVTAGDKEVYRTDVVLAPGEERGISAPFEGPLGGRVTAEIRISDGLSADNRAYAVLAPARSIRALLVGPEDFFLQRALLSLPNVHVSALEIGPDGVVPPGVDVVVWNGVVPPALEEGSHILIGTVPPDLPITATGTVDNPKITSWNRTHPIMASLSMESISISRALKVEARGFTGLLFSGGNPLMLAYEREGLKALYIGFGISGSDLPLRPAFPMLLANALAWFSPGWLSVQAESILTGDPRELGASTGAGPVIVQRPDGGREVVPAAETAAFRNTYEAGFYSVSVAGVKALEFAASLDSASESNIAPRYAFSGTGSAVQGNITEAAGVSFTPLWIALAVIAVALILMEWLLAMRERR